jgi:glycosyltransferase involved in cell wall biosynthesis
MTAADAAAEPCSVSVVISTHNRANECRRAVRSALDQAPSPLEVIVCDDGSTDETPAMIEAMRSREPRLHYIRLAAHGTPAPARNAGIARATGEWLAFLDDDDRWHPGKLAAQLGVLEGGGFDVVAGNAIRSDGSSYFDASGPTHPDRAQIERANPVILSSSAVRAAALADAGGFDEDPRLRGVEDYALWLRLAERGARFLVLSEPLVDYADHGGGRLSTARLATQRRLLLLRAQRWRSHPADSLTVLSLAREAYLTLRLALEVLLTRRDRER